MSYCIPIFLRAVFCAKSFVRGDFHLGMFGVPVAYIAWLWLFITSLFLFWPSSGPVDKYNMNYTCVIVGAVFIFAGVYWLVSARKFFTGPKRVDAAVFKEIARLSRAAAEKAAAEAASAPV